MQTAKTTARNIYLATFVAATALTAIIWLTAGALQARFDVVNEKFFAFYYPWQTRNPASMAYITAWVGYALHNILAWGIIFAAQRARPKYGSNFQWFNWAMLAVNAGGYLLHWVQTQLWYDGLAIAVPEVTSQGSVILMLVFILILENPRRGLFFGKKVNFKQRFIQVVRRYHGYLFSWGIIYTFWYHPMENTIGHLAGFFYIFLLMAQSVLIFNRSHVNKYWTFTLEAFVLVHGTLVAIFQAKGLWPMFFFGFAAMIAITQIYGLGLKPWTTRLFGIGFVVATAAYYLLIGNLAGLNEVIRIPLIEYGLVFAFYLLFIIGNGVSNLFRSHQNPVSAGID